MNGIINENNIDCIVKIKIPLEEKFNLKDPKYILADKPIHSIYAICDPRKTGMFWYCEDNDEPKLTLFEEPFYIGQTIKFRKRKNEHLDSSINHYNINPFKEELIREILSEGLEPIFIVLKEKLYFEEVNYWEQYYIKLIGRINGSLLNMTDGGSGSNGFEKK
jgi:hypothetical protein